MRGGRFEQRKGDGNMRDAEALLESRSVGEIRQVEAATRKEIQDKQEELRQLVGASYRDLIDSADSILIMANCCHSIMFNLAGMEQSLNSISVAEDTVETRQNSCDREEVYGTGSRVKYLVDTPEKIWGCLDEHMYLEGAERYLRARQVYALLLHTNAASTRFPLLRHQWPLVETFHGQISTRARERLQETGLSAADYAVALAAIAIVEDLSSSQLFSLFLDTRKAWLRNYMRAAVQPGANLHVLLCEAVDMIHVTLSHIAQLFLEVSHGTAPLVFATILTAPPSSQLFGGIPNPDKEVAAWKLHRRKLEESMESLPDELLAQGSLSFLEVCGQEISVEAEPIFGAISSGKELVELELCLRLHMNKQTVLQDSLDWLRSGFGQVITSPWDVLTTLLLKTSLNLWDTIFEGLFVQRVKAIVDCHLERINIVEMVDLHLKAIQTSSTCFQKSWIGLVGSFSLPNGTDDTRLVPTKDREWHGEISLYFGPEVSRLQQEVNDGLKRILEDLLMFVGNPQGSSRMAELAPFLHDRVMRCMLKISDEVQARLEQLSQCLNQGSASPDNMDHIERALFLGRLALSLGEPLHYLPIILGPSELWRTETAESSVQEGGHLHPRRNHWPEGRKNWTSETSKKYRNLQSRLATQWDVAHTLWVAWSTEMLVDKFFTDLCMDCSLSASASKGWEETVIRQEADGTNVEIKITLPATASPSAVGLLFAANQEIYRVGGHTLNRRTIHSFVSELLDKVLTAYERFLEEHALIAERGSIQLLFDIRLLADVLSGMQEDMGVKQKGRREEKLLSALHKNLDPIDWATYEPQLWENEQRSYQRCAVLFGFMTQLNRLHTELVVKNQPGSEANIMGLSTSVPRFTSLPVSVPVVSSGEVQHHPKESSDEDFTFDDSAGLTSPVNSRPLFKSLMGQVGSRIGESTLRFGSMIGDGQVGRLRDRFGDMLPQALSSLDAWNVPLA